VNSMASDRRTRGAAIRDAAAIFRRRWWVVAACVVVLPGAVYFYTARQEKTYEARAIVQPQPTGPTGAGGSQPTRQANTGVLRGYAGSSRVTGATLKSLRPPSGSVGALTSSFDETTGLITLTASATTARLAVDAATAYGRALVRYAGVNLRRQIDTQISGARQALARTRGRVQRRAVRDTLSSLAAFREATLAPVSVVSTGDAQLTSPHPGRNALLALILALLISPALVMLFDRFDRTLRRPTELERVVGHTLLTRIPREAFGSGRDGPRAVRAFQRLRDSLVFFDPDRRPDTVAIVSPLEGEGRTTVAVGLARSLADAGRRVALVDADLRDPGVASRMGVRAMPGLSDLLEGRGDLNGVLCLIDGIERRLTVLPAGSPSTLGAELLGSKQMAGLLAWLSEHYDFVVIDTSPFLASTGTLALVARTSGVVAVARLNQTPRDAVRRMVRIATAGGGRILGAVATGATSDGREAETATDGRMDSRRFPQANRAGANGL
jgi:capsular exopolysaccharide synthesis family protein